MAEAGLAAAGPKTSLSLDFDEDDYESMRSQAELRSRSGNRFGAEWWAADADATEALVRKVGSGFRYQWISSVEDQATLRARHPVLDPALLPNAVEIPDAPRRRDNGATLLFVGSLGYLPNVEGLLWFAGSIWPRLRRRAERQLRLVVVGPNTPPEISALGRLGPIARLLGRKPDIKVLGPVANLRPLYEQATLAIAPLQGGRGTRLKLLEAAAEGVAVVATTDAARGLPLTPPWAWIANGSVDFCDACLIALHDEEERSRRVAQGRALVAGQFDRAKTVAALAHRFANLLETRSR
jgi:glycosyltransferase involved in cell wall biosynthesis